MRAVQTIIAQYSQEVSLLPVNKIKEGKKERGADKSEQHENVEEVKRLRLASLRTCKSLQVFYFGWSWYSVVVVDIVAAAATSHVIKLWAERKDAVSMNSGHVTWLGLKLQLYLCTRLYSGHDLVDEYSHILQCKAWLNEVHSVFPCNSLVGSVKVFIHPTCVTCQVNKNFENVFTQAAFCSPPPSTDCAQGLPDRPVPGEDAEDPGRHQGQVPAVPVQPALQDPPPVAHVPVGRHAPRCPQLAVPQHHRSPGAGDRRGKVSPPPRPPPTPTSPPTDSGSAGVSQTLTLKLFFSPRCPGLLRLSCDCGWI